MQYFATSLLAFVLLAGQVSAHSRVFSYSVGGKDQGKGEGAYLRQPPTNDPIKDLNSKFLACNVNGATKPSSAVTVAAGSKFTPEWFHDNRGDDIIAESHHGPIITYLAPAASNGEGNVWVKIAEDGYDASKGWAIDRMRANGGKHDVTLPASLAPGDYIVRVELLALHESNTLHSQDADRGIQLYPSCGQLKVTGSGSATLPAGVAFPGAYTDSTPGIKFDIYSGFSSYPIPGPAVWNAVSGGGGSPAPVSSVGAPKPSSSVAPKPTTQAPAPVPTTQAPAPVTTTQAPAPVPTTQAPAPVTTTAAPAPVPTTETPAPVPTTEAPAPVPTTQAPVPAPAPSGGAKDANTCYREYNKCLDVSQPKPDFEGCTATRDSCVVGASFMRLARSGTIGRRFV